MKKNSLLPILIVIALICAAIWYFDKNYLNQTVVFEDKTEIPVTQNEKTKFTGTFYYAVKLGKNINLYRLDLSSNQKELIYSDSEEKFKISQFDSAGINEKVLIFEVVQGKVNEGRLSIIDLKSGQKEIFSESFFSSEELVLGDNLNKIAYVSFSNVEENYGYSLYVQAKNQKAKKVLTSEDPITKVKFFADKLYYISAQTLYVYDQKSDKKEKVLQDFKYLDYLLVNNSLYVLQHADSKTHLLVLDMVSEKKTVLEISGLYDAMQLSGDLLLLKKKNSDNSATIKLIDIKTDQKLDLSEKYLFSQISK